MSEKEDFLNRWSRRKQEAAKESAAEAAKADEPPVAAEQPATADEPAEEEFDISTLPPVESITAGTDIRAFLSKGVPAALTQAALRRAWTADPAIRDYIGLSEYSWDFNAPGQYGFGALDPSLNVKDMVADVFGKVKEAVAKTDELIEKTEAAKPQVEAVPAEPPRSVDLRDDSTKPVPNSLPTIEHSEVGSGDKSAQVILAPQQSESESEPASLDRKSVV